MALKDFKTLNLKDEIFNRIQDNVKSFCAQLTPNITLDGVRSTSQLITSSGTEVVHSLGRQPIGWYILDRNAGETIYRTAWDTKTITLKATGAVTVDIWVF
jgi:hypothetical protein